MKLARGGVPTKLMRFRWSAVRLQHRVVLCKVTESAERVAGEAIDENPIHDKMADSGVRCRNAHSLSAGKVNTGAAANVMELRDKMTAWPCHNSRRRRHHTQETCAESHVRDRASP